MKKIVAIIQPHALPAVKQSLFSNSIFKVTVTNALGCGEEERYHESFRGVDHEVDLLKRVRLEIAVNGECVERTIEAIIRGARTDTVGDGKIFISNLEDCVRIRTGERGQLAIG